MSDDPQVQLYKKIAAWKAAGATPEDLDALIAEYEHAHRFADPNAPATVTGSKERIIAGPEVGGRGDEQRQETGGEALMGGLGQAAHGLSLGTSDELGGLIAGAGALLPGGQSPAEAYRKTRDINRATQHTFVKEHPVAAPVIDLASGALNPLGRFEGPATVGKVAKTGALIGGVAGFGNAEGDFKDQITQTALGAAGGAGLGVLGYGAIKSLPAIGRLFGIQTTKGQEGAAVAAIKDAVERHGQTLEGAQARYDAAVAAGQTPTLIDILGPKAGREALDQLASLSNPAAARASLASEQAGEPEIAKALYRAARRKPPKANPLSTAARWSPAGIGFAGTGGNPLGALGGAALTGANAVRRAAVAKMLQKQSESVLDKLLSPAETFFKQPVPTKATQVPYLQLMKGKGPIITPPPNPEQQALQSMLTEDAPKPSGSILSNTNFANMPSESMIQRRVARLRSDVAARKGAGSQEAELRALAEFLADPANQDDNLETLLKLSLVKRP